MTHTTHRFSRISPFNRLALALAAAVLVFSLGLYLTAQAVGGNAVL